MMKEMNEDEEVVPLVLPSGADSKENEDQTMLLSQQNSNGRNQRKRMIINLLLCLLISAFFFCLGVFASTTKQNKTKQNINSLTNSDTDKVTTDTNEKEETMTTKHESTKQNNSNDHLLLNTYTYSNCPLTMTKFSQFEMAKDGNFKSEQDKRTNSIDRAKLALDFSNDALAYERVVTALEKNAFNRTIVLDGDSLTRQLFISLGCLAWAAGYVTDFDMHHATTLEGDTNTILINSELHASSTYIGQASVTLRGGGTIYYVGTASREAIDKYQEHVMESCKSRKKIFEGRYSFDLKDLKPLSKKDIVVVAAGHHAERETIISYYKEFLECVREDDSDDHFQEWPKFFYQSMSNENFWTMDGLIQGEKIPGKDGMSCQPSVNTTVFRTKETEILKGFVPLIGYDIKVEDLGEYHPGHGDCLHWIQPGVSDLYAAELADIALAMMEGE